MSDSTNWIIIWCGFIVIGGAVSRGQGWGIPLGALLGLLLGPLGVVITMCLKDKNAPPGLVRVTCPRCSASQNVEADKDFYDCWQCKLRSKR